MSPIQAYLDLLREQRRHANNTLLAIERDLQKLSDLVQPESSCAAIDTQQEPVNPVFLSQLGADVVRAGLSRLRAQGLSASSLARLASTWRQFFRHLEHSGMHTQNPMAGIRTPKKPRRLPKALTPDQALAFVQPLSDTGSDSEATPVQDEELSQTLTLALAELLYSSGLRISECIGLDMSEQAFAVRSRLGPVLGGWIDWAADEIHVMGKGAKRRVVPLTSHAAWRLQAWLSIRGLRSRVSPCDALFLSVRGQRLSVRAAQRLLEHHSQHSAVGQHVHPHMLRHSFASHVLQSSGDLRAVQELMGHASIASTQVYTALDFQHLSAIYDKAHPRARKRNNP